ncbi:MAG TPA: ABC transporter ATP-binding protein [Ilumatobacteraceae bacterium]|nr:ABC transporter ATP-binding protein [Ilumatobacteraceae bacterium]
MAQVELQAVSVVSDGVRRLDDVSLVLHDGEFVGVVGESGSGKSTLLRTIAGLERVASGVIRLDDVDVTRATPADRDVGFVFQEPVLFGHISVGRNVAFPLEIRRTDADEIRERVGAEMRAFNIEGLARRDPTELSRGEQQMVQIARTLVRVPKVLLLDEPFAALDEPRRVRLRSEIAALQSGYGVTTLMSTNDSLDVTALAASLAVLSGGRLVQFDQTSVVRRSPATVLAALATGPMDFIEMRVVADGGGYWLLRDDPGGGQAVRIRSWAPALAGHVGAAVTVGVRPAEVMVSVSGSVPAVVERAAVLQPGGVVCLVGGRRVTAMLQPGHACSSGDQVRLRVDRHVVFDKPSGNAIT